MTYSYGCAACKHEWEEEQKITDEPVKICPKCKAETAQRLIVSGNFVLKGQHWFKDGY